MTSRSLSLPHATLVTAFVAVLAGVGCTKADSNTKNPPGGGGGDTVGGDSSPGDTDGGTWLCDPDYRGDGSCDCSCGAVDPDCGGAGCIEPGCKAAGCEYCYDDQQQGISCVVVPDGWTCDESEYSDGFSCDCGCGVDDEDCDPPGCTAASCLDAACSVCHDGSGAEISCAPAGWECSGSYYYDDDCDCGCGVADPTCAGNGCFLASCFDPACDYCYDALGDSIGCMPAGWSCLAGQYNDGTCDCGCGALDADCATGCSGPGCSGGDCSICHVASGSGWDCTSGPGAGTNFTAGYNTAAPPNDGVVVIAWVGQNADWVFGSGAIANPTDLNLTFASSPPVEAFIADGLALGFVYILPNGTAAPEGPLDADPSLMLGASDRHAIVYRTSADTGAELPWSTAFATGFSCGVCVPGADFDPDTFAVANCTDLDVHVGALADQDFCNW